MSRLPPLSRLVVTAALLALCGCGGSSNPPGERTIKIATNPAGTLVYAASASLAKLIQEQAGRRATIQPFSGSSVYLPMLQRGELALGLNTSIDGYLAYRGLPPYSVPMHNLRTLGMIFPIDIAFMVRGDSGLRSIEDLRGKRVVVTFRANAALEQLHRGILATGGLDFDDIQAQTVAGLPEGVQALQDGSADAVPIGLGTALALQADASLPAGIRYLTMGQYEARLPEIMPGTHVVTVEPHKGRIGISEPIRVSRVADMLNTGTHMSDDDAYAIVKTIYTNWDALRKDLPSLAGILASEMAPADNMHPYHPGAVRFYREAGLWTETHERNQRELLALAGDDAQRN